MVDAHERKPPSESQRLGKVEPYEKRAGKARAPSDRDGIDGAPAACPFDSFLENGKKLEEMLPRGDLRDDASETRVKVGLGSNGLREKKAAVLHDGRRAFVTRGLDSEYAHVPSLGAFS